MNTPISRNKDETFQSLIGEQIAPLISEDALDKNSVVQVKEWVDEAKNSLEITKLVHDLNEELKISKTLSQEVKLMTQLERKIRILDITSTALTIATADNKPKATFEEGVKLAAGHVASRMIVAPIAGYIGAAVGSVVPGAGTIALATVGYAAGATIDAGAGLASDVLFDGNTKKITQALTNDSADYDSTLEHVVAVGAQFSPLGMVMQLADGSYMQNVRKHGEMVRELF